MSAFPFGRALLVMVALAIAGAVGLLIAPAREGAADLEVWAFADIEAWRAGAQAYQAKTGKRVVVREVSARAIDTRLLSLTMSGRRGGGVPDVVMVEIGSVGKYFRPPAEEVGVVPLESRMRRDGLEGHFVAARLAPWSKGGHLFGLPLDVHPVSVTYRRDLFEQAGVGIDDARSWKDFQDRCLAFQQYWAAHGSPERVAMELPEGSADVLYMMLLQRGVNIVDEGNRVRIDDPLVLDTVVFYAGLVAGERRIGHGVGGNAAVRVRSLVEGDVCATVTPDWGIAAIREWGAELDGKLAMMPLPRFSEGDYPTSTWGGTMAAIPRGCRDVEAAWELLKFLATAPEVSRYRANLPALVSSWADPRWSRPDPLFGGQPVGALYVDLAGRLPPRVVTPFTTLAVGQLSRVLHRAVQEVDRGTSESELRDLCREWLREARSDLERYIRFGEFE